VEVALGNYLVLLTRVVTRHVMTTAEIDDLFDQLCRKTLGTNIRAVKRLLVLKQAQGELEEANRVLTARTPNMLAMTDMPESFSEGTRGSRSWPSAARMIRTLRPIGTRRAGGYERLMEPPSLQTSVSDEPPAP
jgi:hypothetical protein